MCRRFKPFVLISNQVLFAIILWIMVCGHAHAQYNAPEASPYSYTESQQDSLMEAVDNISYTQPNEAIALADELLHWQTFLQTPNPKFTANVNVSKGKALRHTGRYDEAYAAFRSALQMAQGHHFTQEEAMAYNGLAAIKGNQDERDSALYYYFSVQRMEKDLDSSYTFLVATIEMGHVYQDMRSYDRAREFYTKGLKASLKKRDSLATALAFSHIGLLHIAEENFSAASDTLHIGLKVFQKKNNHEKGLGYLYNVLGRLHAGLSDYDSAFYYQQLSLDVAYSIADVRGISQGHHALGNFALAQGLYDMATEQYHTSLATSERIGYQSMSMLNYAGLAKTHNAFGPKDSVMYYAQKALKLALAIREVQQEANIYSFLAGVFGDLNDYEQAFRYQSLYAKTSERLFNDNVARELRSMEMSIRLAERESQIENLKKHNTGQQERLSQSASYIQYLIIGLLIALLLGVGLYINNMYKAHANRILEGHNREILRQKEEIETKNTEIAYKNEELKETNEQLNGLNNEKNYLMSIVAHDLKSPLNQIVGLVNLVKSTPATLNEDQTFYLDTINKSAGRLSEMIQRILDVQRLQKNVDEEVKKEQVDLREMLEFIAQTYTTSARGKQISLNTDLSEGLWVTADKSYTMQVFENLVSNSIKFSPRGKEVCIRAYRQNGSVVTEVIDQGPGVSDEDKKRMFGRFQTLSARPTGGEKSFGLGLSIVKRYVDAMEGRVWCESAPNEGATFKVLLKGAEKPQPA